MCEERGVVCGVGCVRKAWKGRRERHVRRKGEFEFVCVWFLCSLILLNDQ